MGSKPPDILFETAGDPDFVINAWLFSTAIFGETLGPVWRKKAGTA